MPYRQRAQEVSVSIVNAKSQAVPSGWRIDYQVSNAGDGVKWLIDDASLALREGDDRIELSFARAPMQPGVQVIGYFEPQTARLDAGASLHRTVHISWPCPLSDIWNPSRETAPAPGWYFVTVRIGFAHTPSPPPQQQGEDIEATVLAWQQQAISMPVRIAVAPYASMP